MHCVTFKLAEGEFGVGVDRIREVLSVPPISALPQAPDFVEGVVTIRGHSIVTVDLRRCLRLGGDDIKPAAHMIIARVEGMIMGLLVDSVDGVLEISDDAIDVASEMADKFMTGKVVSGVAHHEGRDIIVLDLDEVLAQDQRDTLKSFGR